jgi:WD40 repeat protein
VWRLSDGAETFTLKAAPDAQDDTITEVAFSPDGQRLAASATSPTTTNMVQIWRLDTGNLPGVFPGSGSPDLSFAPDGQLLAVSTDRAGVLLIRPEDHSLSGTLRAPSAADCVRWNDCADRERRAAFSLDNQYIASVTEGGTLQIWRLSDHKLLRTLRVSMTEDIRQLAFSPDGRYLATSAFDDSSFVDTVQLWRVADLTK